jgi:NTE family protein
MTTSTRPKPKRAKRLPAVKAEAKTKAQAKETIRLNLALQGGGAHGAFTWGVLDRLLADETIEIVGISGTSAGAMNAAVLVDGYREGGREAARKQLRDFWYEISVESKKLMPLGPQRIPDYITEIPGLEWMAALNPADMLSRVFSPYELNPFNYNPIKTVLERMLSRCNLVNGIPLFVTATNVETGEARVFREHEISIEVLLASACLPFVYQAVEIDGVPYWDGGYMGNPAIWPLIYGTDCQDVLLVQINPLLRKGTPKTAIDIINRVNEISFNSSLLAEMRAIDFVKRLIKQEKISDRDYMDVRMHRVMPPPDLREMSASSKMEADWEFFQALFTLGSTQTDQWLKSHRAAIGHHSSVDIKEGFLAKGWTKEKNV